MLNAMHFGVFATLFAVLVVVVNILTQIFKSFLNKTEIPTRVFVLFVSVILTVVNRAQAVRLRQYARSVDQQSFVLITNTTEIIGKGFRGVI